MRLNAANHGLPPDPERLTAIARATLREKFLAAEMGISGANFLVAESGATSRQVLDLIEDLRARVAERLGIELETAIEIW